MRLRDLLQELASRRAREEYDPSAGKLKQLTLPKGALMVPQFPRDMSPAPLQQ